jgi:branched-chain amino acid transport system permease protein
MPLTSLWRLLLGLSIIAMVLIFPRGLAGTVRHWREERA